MAKRHYYTKAESEMRMAANHLGHRIIPEDRGGYGVHRSDGDKRALRLSPLFATVAAADEWFHEQISDDTSEFRRDYDAEHEKRYIAAAMKGGLSEAEARADYYQDGAA
jgi:hypothetical protein